MEVIHGPSDCGRINIFMPSELYAIHANFRQENDTIE